MTTEPAAATGDRRATAAFVAVLLLSVVVLFSPRSPGEQGIPNLDKVVHAALFALLTAATWWRFGDRSLALAALLAYGVVSEVAQAVFVPSRDGDVRDVLADTAGVLVGWLLSKRLATRRTVRDQLGEP